MPVHDVSGVQVWRRRNRGEALAHWAMWLIGAWLQGWFHAKLMLVILMSAFHGFCVVWMKEFERDERKRRQRFYRFVNEIPTVIMIAVVILVIVKPF